MAYFREQDISHLCIQKLSDQFETTVRLIGYQSVGGGCINNAAKLTTSVGEFFLKWNAHAPDDMFLKEAAGLREMSLAGTSLVIPKVIWSKETDETPGLLLMEFLSGPASTTGFDEKLGQGIAQMHRKTAANFGFYHDNYCGTTVQKNAWTNTWPEFYAQNRIHSLVLRIKSQRGMSSEDQRIYDRLIDRLPQLLSHETSPSLIHGDLWSGNYMYTANGTALIDPACYYADREMELGMMKLFGGFSVRVWDAYQSEFPLLPEWKQRIQLYQLYHILNHYLLFGGSYGWQALEIAKSYL